MALSRPIAVAGGNQEATIGVPFLLDGTASSDPEGFDIDTYAWFLLYSPPGSTDSLIDDDTANPTITPDVVGTYRVFLVVTAGGRSSEPDPLKAPESAFANVIIVTVNNGWTIPARGQPDWDAFMYQLITDLDDFDIELPSNVMLEGDNLNLLGSGSEGVGLVPHSDGAGAVVWAQKIPDEVMFEGEDAALLGSGSATVGQVLIADGAGGSSWGDISGGLSFDITGFSLTSSSLIEVGDSLTDPGFSASYVGTVDTATVEDDEGTGAVDVSGTPTSFTYTQTYTKTTYGDSVQWTLDAQDSFANADSASVTATWVQKIFWGVDVAGLSTEADIEGLANSQLASSRAKTFTVTAGPTEKIYYAYRSVYGEATFTVGGFSGGFTKVSDTISVTNTFGFTEDYTLYESDNVGLGEITVTVT